MVKDLKKIFRKNPEAVWKDIGDDLVIIPLWQDSDIINDFYVLEKKSAIYIWKLIDGRRSVEEIKRSVVKNFRVEPKEAQRDLLGFLTKLKKIKAII